MQLNMLSSTLLGTLLVEFVSTIRLGLIIVSLSLLCYLVKIRILSDEEIACHSYANEVCFYEADFTCGFHFPVHPFVREIFSYLHLALALLVPNSWRIIVSCMVVWMSTNDGNVIKRDKFLHFYCLRKSKDPSYYEFKPWNRASRLILDYPSSL